MSIKISTRTKVLKGHRGGKGLSDFREIGRVLFLTFKAKALRGGWHHDQKVLAVVQASVIRKSVTDSTTSALVAELTS